MKKERREVKYCDLNIRPQSDVMYARCRSEKHCFRYDKRHT